MTHQINVLRQARHDYEDLRAFVINNYPEKSWQECQDQLKSLISYLTVHPNGGAIPLEIVTLNLPRYRQIASGKLRIIYEVRQKQIFIHIILGHRRDLNSLLFRRLMRVS